MLLEEAVTEKRDVIVHVMFVPRDLNAAAVLLHVCITVCLLLCEQDRLYNLMKLLVLRVDAAFVLTDMHKLFFVCVVITRDESLTSYPAEGCL